MPAVSGDGQQMSAQRIGRNDPCPCGSGKKYKRCCLPQDEAQAAASRPPVIPDDGPDARERAAADPPLDFSDELTEAEERAADTGASGAPPQGLPPFTADPRNIPRLLKELARKAPRKDRALYKSLLAETGPLLEYVERQPEIEAAQEAIEAHRPALVQLFKDPEACRERTQRLFTEERFAPLRFTAQDVQRAFDKLGKPSSLATSDKFTEKVFAAILFLADKERRSQLSTKLLLHLPDLVAEGRPLDACLVDECAYRTTEYPEESNPFLFEMFSAGYDAWVAGGQQRERAMLRELGLDPERMERMSLDEVEAWIREQEQNPAMAARMEKFLEAHPEQRTEATANLQELERSSITLLQRPDASGLLLSAEEVAPWLPALNERLAPLLGLVPANAGSTPDPAVTEKVFDALWPALGEMAGKIFTPERLGRLLDQLRTYRNERFASGDKRTAGQALGATAALERKDAAGRNYFLGVLCYVSLRRLLDTIPR